MGALSRARVQGGVVARAVVKAVVKRAVKVGVMCVVKRVVRAVVKCAAKVVVKCVEKRVAKVVEKRAAKAVVKAAEMCAAKAVARRAGRSAARFAATPEVIGLSGRLVRTAGKRVAMPAGEMPGLAMPGVAMPGVAMRAVEMTGVGMTGWAAVVVVVVVVVAVVVAAIAGREVRVDTVEAGHRRRHRRHNNLRNHRRRLEGEGITGSPRVGTVGRSVVLVAMRVPAVGGSLLRRVSPRLAIHGVDRTRIRAMSTTSSHRVSSRREFMASAVLLAGAAAVVPAFGAPPPPPRLRKAIMWGTVGVKGSVLEKMRAVKEAGFEGVEPGGGMDQDEVVRALEATGLEAASVCCHTHWQMPLSDPNPATRAIGLGGLQQSLRDAKRYGAGSVLLVPAVVNERVGYAEAWDRSIVEIRKAVPLAEELGVTISIENVWNNFLLSPLEAGRYVDEFRSPRVGWHFDIGNVIHYGWPEQWIRVLGKRIQRLHLKEYSREKSDKEGKWAGFNVEFLKGSNNWHEIMKALGEIGYSGWAIAEQGGGGSAEGLRKLSDDITAIFAS